MANILGLALKVTGDASGLAKSLTPVDRALDSLAKQADRATAVFTPFAEKSAAAAKVQEDFAAKLANLSQQLKDNLIGPKEYADAFAKLSDEAKAASQAFDEGLRITRENATEEERRTVELQRLSDLLELGAISQETFNRAADKATGAEKDRADAAAKAARIIQATLTPQQLYDQQMQELTQHLQAGRLTQDQFNRAAQKARADLAGVASSAEKTDKNITSLNRNVSILSTIEIGRTIVSGLQTLQNVFTSVTSQVTNLVSSVNTSLDTLNDFSDRTGIGVEALQGYQLAAKLAGVDTEQFGTAVQKLAVNIGKATPGDQLDKSLRAINLSVTELRALSPEQQFSTIGQAISQLPTAADRAAAAVEIFGKQGAALAPLFREGAASIEELRARAEKLGIIVNETQINNIDKMNKGFDLVRSTIQGIIGQVIGNLAPAVTDVTNQFLKFVEEWTGAQGTGGTGIANAITDVLLQGAEYLAGVFDVIVEKLAEFAATFESNVQTFSGTAAVFTVLTETLRGAFILFQAAGTALAEGLGHFLEGLGSWVSSDLELAGKQLQETAQANGDALAQQFDDVATNIQNAFNGNQAEKGGAGAAESYVKAFRERFAQQQLPEVKVAANLDKAQQQLDAYFKVAGSEADKFFVQSKDTLEVFRRLTSEGNLLPAQIKMMNGFMDDLNAKLQTELATRREASEAARQQAEADQKRIEGLLNVSNEASQLQQDIDAVARESVRVQEQLAAARQDGMQQEADAAAARLGQLDQLQAKLMDEQQAVEQGFGQGFTQAFAETQKGINDLVVKAEQFGNVGARAAQSLQQGIESTQQKVRDGILSKDAYEQEVKRQEDVFNQKISGAKIVEEFLHAQLSDRQRAELEATRQLEERKKQAALNVQAIEERLMEEQRAFDEARANNDVAATKQAATRISQLKQAQRAEEQIANGQGAAFDRRMGQQQQSMQRAQEFDMQAQRLTNASAQSFQNAYDSANAALEQSAANAAKQAEKIRQILTPGPRTVQTADIRTAEGAALVMNLTANEQDPQLIEARQQTKQLRQLNQNLVASIQAQQSQVVEIM